jgi:hypothetical protein
VVILREGDEEICGRETKIMKIMREGEEINAGG